MATLKTNTLTGTSTAGSIAVTGEGNSTTTNLQQGLAKAWCLFDQSAPEIDDSFNSASLTDSAKGKGIVNFTNNMGGALTYSCTMGAVNGNDNDPYCSALTANRNYVTQTTSAFPFRNGYSGHSEGSGNSPYADFFDPNGALVVAFGDLA
tara:strand:+ start:567 stop:1016 length:450 start_codon:yes stop_codon:yes gene_type:complete